MKKALIISSLLSFNLFANEEIIIPDYNGETYIKAYDKLASTFGIVKSVPEHLSNSKSIQELYLKTKDNQQFNYHSLNYFLKLNNNLKGFSPKGQLVYNIPELNNLYREYSLTTNTIKRQIIENHYREVIKQKAILIDYSYFDNKTFYSGMPLLGAYKFDFEKQEKKVIFETQRINYPAVYINCYKNGEMVGLFYSNEYRQDTEFLPLNVNKTPIVLKFPKEISDKFEYTERTHKDITEKNLCLHKETFEDLSKAELYETLINDSHNQFFVFFNIDSTYRDFNYLVGNVIAMGLFSYDNSDYMHMPYSLWEGKTHNKENIQEIIKSNLIKNNEIKKGFNNLFLKNSNTYVFDNDTDTFFIQGIEDGDRARMIMNRTSLVVEYKIEYFEDYLELTLDKILKDSASNFPIKMIISKNNAEGQSSKLALYAQMIDRPHYYKELYLDLKKGFLFDWKKNVD